MLKEKNEDEKKEGVYDGQITEEEEGWVFRSLKTLAGDLWKSLVLLKYKEKEVSSFGMWNSPQRKATKGPSVHGTTVVADICELIGG